MTYPVFSRLQAWIDEPLPVLRIEVVRIFAPLAVLGFMSGRLAHADEWIGDAGFRVPDLGGDWRQPIFVPALPTGAAWAVAVAMVLSGLACSAGFRTRASALVFAATLAFVAVSDRLAAFTVSKISPVIMLAVALGPAGTRLGLDAWRKRRRGGKRPPKTSTAGSVRFLQLLVVTIYSASGIAKARGDWLKVPNVLWTQLFDSYQTPFAFGLASVLPAWAWTAFQGLVLAFELFAPLWFGLAKTRSFALAFGLGMHAMIGLMFGPVLWFALLMMTLLAAGYLPERLLAPLETLAGRLEKKRPRLRETPARAMTDAGEG
jgi:vitamin K-dependent gamma-carboxylase-like protein